MATKYYGGFEIIKEESVDNGVKLSFGEALDAVGEKYTPRDMILSLVTYKNAVTDEPIDLDELRDNRLNPVIEKVLETFLEHNIFIGHGKSISSDMEYIFTNVITSVRSWRTLVEEAHWGYPEHLLTYGILKEHYEKHKDMIPNLSKKTEQTP